mmetsp:Transcript_15428/g.17931  ORF Transcript_15428/g.17931 Transcript_15428/m.17931 type:complete len:805 (-) Transcript_15428:961-3375(-)
MEAEATRYVEPEEAKTTINTSIVREEGVLSKDRNRNEKVGNLSYVSSCSDSSNRSSADDNEEDEVKQGNDSNISNTVDKTSTEKPFDPSQNLIRDEEDEQKIDNNAIDKATIECVRGGNNLSTSKEELSQRVQSLESQLAQMTIQMEKLINSITLPKNMQRIDNDASSQVSTKLSNTPDEPFVERLNSLLSIESSPEVLSAEMLESFHEVAQTPNLEYRSYTPTYEEELLKYRKSSRGMSIDNTSKSENEIDHTSGKNRSNEVKQFFDTKVTLLPPSRMTPDCTNLKQKNFHTEVDLNKNMNVPEKKGVNDESKDTTVLTCSINVPGNQQQTKITEAALSPSVNTSFAKCESTGWIRSKTNTIMSFFDSLNLDSKQQDGSASEDVDKNMEEFLRVPFRIEELMAFGIIICADAFLHVLTVTPLKFIWSCLCLVCSILNLGKGIFGCRFHRRHLYQLIRVLVIYAVYAVILRPISIGKMYHWIRGQAMLKLYVLMAMVEVFDRLMCSFGQDAMDSLFWNTTKRPFHPRMIASILVVFIYASIHSFILFIHVATLNVAMNSSDQALLTLLISGNFAEIKSTVFKKYTKQNLFKIATSDICERFKLVLFLTLVLLLNCSQGGMNQEMVNDYIVMSAIILSAEMLCDWIKHSFITKFNFIKCSAYQGYALILAGDITGVGQDGLNIDHTHAIVKRIGFPHIPLVCVMARYVAEASRYAVVLSDDGDSNHVMYSIAVLLTRGSWSLVASTYLIAFFVSLLVLKALLGHFIEKKSHSILVHGSSDEDTVNIHHISDSKQGSKPTHRRQAV